jgi:hypothetical protein
MSAYPPPIRDLDEFNPNDYYSTSGSITIEEGDDRYLKQSGGIASGLITFNAGLTGTTISGTTISGPSISSGSNTDLLLKRNTTTKLTLGSALATFADPITTSEIQTVSVDSGSNNDIKIQRNNVDKITVGTALTTFADPITTSEVQTVSVDSGANADIKIQRNNVDKITVGSALTTFADPITTSEVQTVSVDSGANADIKIQRNNVDKITVGTATTAFADPISTSELLCPTIDSNADTNLTLQRNNATKLIIGATRSDFYTDLSVNQTTSGGEVVADISNFSNTAGSDAKLKLFTFGGGGDSFIHFTNTITDYAVGLDNSDSDKFKISNNSTLGTNDIVAISSSDITLYKPVSNAYQPYMLVSMATTTQSINNGTATVIRWNQITTSDVSSVISYSNGAGSVYRFSFTKTGYYLCSMNVFFDTGAGQYSGYRALRFQVDGTSSGDGNCNASAVLDSVNDTFVSISTVIYIASTSYLEAVAVQGNDLSTALNIGSAGTSSTRCRIFMLA